MKDSIPLMGSEMTWVCCYTAWICDTVKFSILIGLAWELQPKPFLVPSPVLAVERAQAEMINKVNRSSV